MLRLTKLQWYATFACLLLIATSTTVAQPTDPPTKPKKYESPYPSINEKTFKNTRWKYTQTLHVDSKTPLHEASKEYQFFLYFKEDFKYSLYLNGEKEDGNWLIDPKGSQVYFNFRNIRWWQVIEVNQNHLVLEFKVGSGVFQYGFEKATTDETAFFDQEEAIEAFADTYEADKTEAVKAEKEKKKMDDITPPAPPAIEIQLVGGGYFGGIDPVLKDYIHLKPNGRLIREIETVQNGLVKSAKDVSREDMEKLVEFIENKTFFEMDNTYDCTSGDCMKRKQMRPTPVPLTLVVQHGNKRKVVVITVYGQDDRRGNYVKYPKEIDLIIQNIKLLAGE